MSTTAAQTGPKLLDTLLRQCKIAPSSTLRALCEAYLKRYPSYDHPRGLHQVPVWEFRPLAHLVDALHRLSGRRDPILVNGHRVMVYASIEGLFQDLCADDTWFALEDRPHTHADLKKQLSDGARRLHQYAGLIVTVTRQTVQVQTVASLSNKD